MTARERLDRLEKILLTLLEKKMILDEELEESIIKSLKVPERKNLVDQAVDGEVNLEGGANKFRVFVKKINEENFMKKFRGVGKRKAQSILYQLRESIIKKGGDLENFNLLIERLNEHDYGKNDSLPQIKEEVKSIMD